MNILALDCGTRTGWAVWYGGGPAFESGVQSFELRRGESAGERFIRFRAWLRGVLMTSAPAAVVYKRPHVQGGPAVELLIGMTTRIAEECAAFGVEPAAVYSATLKKFATGSGRGDRVGLMKHAREAWELSAVDGSEADALCLLSWALKAHGEK